MSWYSLCTHQQAWAHRRHVEKTCARQWERSGVEWLCMSCCKYGRESRESQATVDTMRNVTLLLDARRKSFRRFLTYCCVWLLIPQPRHSPVDSLKYWREKFCLFMLLVWQQMVRKSRGSGQLVACHTTHLVDWLVVRVFYAVADFMMLNPIDFSWFVTLTLWHFITPKQCLDRFTAARECDFFETNFVSHLFSLSHRRWID